MCTLSMHFGWSRLKPGIVRDDNPHSKTKEPMTSHNEFLTEMEKVKIYFWIGTIASSGEIEITRWGDGVLGKATVQQIFHIPTPITSWVIQRLYSVLLQFNENTFILSIRPGVEKESGALDGIYEIRQSEELYWPTPPPPLGYTKLRTDYKNSKLCGKCQQP